ncbi:hypothetical protein Val02_89810 [Virgisporangium aliadipatigenens]|uniref:Lipoprotein n=1 Tax=Virgisporangium aliadipatigenens TaxID=741659 RepID=A0A8J3YYI1_9ACTN|nr:hypothetical protein [Virgisporangium aliadipatigenens]GIJ52095.1 hypothetical protein Val02_89810 [Virgisporangium aliadipatigenens]
MTASKTRRVRLGTAIAVAIVSLLTGAACREEGPAAGAAPEPSLVFPTGSLPAAKATRSQASAHFQLPSGNIGCRMQAAWVRCDIQLQTYALPPKPPSCQGIYGKSIRFDKMKKSELSCAADSLLPAPETIEPDTIVIVERMRCVVQESGVTCYDTESGFGFALSRQEYAFLAPS